MKLTAISESLSPKRSSCHDRCHTHDAHSLNKIAPVQYHDYIVHMCVCTSHGDIIVTDTMRERERESRWCDLPVAWNMSVWWPLCQVKCSNPTSVVSTRTVVPANTWLCVIVLTPRFHSREGKYLAAPKFKEEGGGQIQGAIPYLDVDIANSKGGANIPVGQAHPHEYKPYAIHTVF